MRTTFWRWRYHTEWISYKFEAKCCAYDISTHVISIFDCFYELQKAKLVVTKLQKRCTEKASEIKRLKAAEKRSRLARCTLEDMLQEMKQKKWITDEGQDVLNVNELHLWFRWTSPYISIFFLELYLTARSNNRINFIFLTILIKL